MADRHKEASEQINRYSEMLSKRNDRMMTLENQLKCEKSRRKAAEKQQIENITNFCFPIESGVVIAQLEMAKETCTQYCLKYQDLFERYILKQYALVKRKTI